MKKFLLGMLMVSMIAIVVFATNQVSSVNVAGYIKMELQKGKYYMLRNDFFYLGDGGTTISNVLGRQFPLDTKVYAWSTANGGQYIENTYKKYFSGGKWKTNWVVSGNIPSTNLLLPGDGFWVYIPATAPNSTYQINILGEVPNNPTSSIPLSTTYSMLGYPYAAPVVWTNTQLAKQANLNDKLYYWQPSLNNYEEVTYKKYFSGGKWKTNWVLAGNIPYTNSIDIGRGFWYYKVSPNVMYWNENRPYNLD